MNIALKEWSSVTAALAAWRQICLLRKGGIIEADRGGFYLRYQRFLLFPTYQHEHRVLVQESSSRFVIEPTDPNTHQITLLCEVTDSLIASSEQALASASAHFIWNNMFLRKRLDYKPHLPLYAILIRAYRLPAPATIPDRPSYAGCKSWVHLTEEIHTDGALPVLTDAEYASKREQLLTALETNVAVR